ncbi:MAG: hypothetical protein QXS09_02410 [Candidatus Bathyarchaeia archaeon]
MVRYSQEMTNLVYFKIERTDPVITRLRGRRYHRTYGIVLSSFRVVEVLVPLNLHGQIPLDRGKYVYFTKCSNQWTIVRKPYRVCEIHDVECLEKVTSKKSTIPDRLYIRLATWEDIKHYIQWSKIPYLLRENQLRDLYLLVLYYNKGRGIGRYKLDIDLIYVPRNCALKFVETEQNMFIDGIYYSYNTYLVFTNIPYVGLTYSKVVKAIKKVKNCWRTMRSNPNRKTSLN